MSQLHLNAIVTQALLDDEFRAAILNGQRRARLAAFDLTDQEREVVLSIPAHDLDGFIRQIEAYTYPAVRWYESNTSKRSESLFLENTLYCVG
jgi:hypothetical protein